MKRSKPSPAKKSVRAIPVADLEHVDGGVGIHTLGLAPGAVSAPAVNPTGGTNPYGFAPGYGPGFGFGPGFGGGPDFGGGYGGGEGYGGGWHHGGGGHHAMRELFHDPTVQGAFQQFEANHPELTQNLEDNGFGQDGQLHFGRLMHDPAGRELLQGFLQDPSFAGAMQNFSAQHPELAQPLSNALGHMEMRLAQIEQNGGQFFGPNPSWGQGGGYGPFVGPYAPTVYGAPVTATNANGQVVGVDPASLGLDPNWTPSV